MPAGNFDPLFAAVRESVGPSVWSRGVELARGNAVTVLAREAGDLHLAVASGKAVAPKVTLHLDDGEWQCSCGGDDDPCAHVAAAVIAVRQAGGPDRLCAAVPPAARGTLAYAFRRRPDGLAFVRLIVAKGAPPQPYAGSLAALAAGRAAGPDLVLTAGDLAIDLVLPRGRAAEAVDQTPVMADLIRTLADADVPVSLDGAPVAMSAEGIGPIAVVADDGPGVRLSAAPNPKIKEIFPNGAALCADGRLRPVTRPRLAAADLRLLEGAGGPAGTFFGPRDLGDLAGTVLPRLETAMEIVVRTSRLPGRRLRLTPRMVMEVVADGPRMRCVPVIVYGEPAEARLRNGRLELLGHMAPTRDEAAELRLKDELSRKFGLEPETPVMYSATEGVSRLQQFAGAGIEVAGDGAAAFRVRGGLMPELSILPDGLRLSFTLAEGGGGQGRRAAADAGAVLGAWTSGDRLVPLLEGQGYATLPSDWLTRHGARIATLLAATDQDGRLPRALLPALSAACDELGVEKPRPLAELADRFAAFTGLPHLPPDRHFTGTLREYQQRGVDWLGWLRGLGVGGILADDMGLGKTVQILAMLTGRALIAAPTSVLPNWRAELAKFRPDLKVCFFHGTGRRLDSDFDVLLTTHALLRTDPALAGDRTWDILVLDEAQAIKNPESGLKRALGRIRAGFRVALSGTPVENRLDDLWSIMDFASPGLLLSRQDFRERFSSPVTAGDPVAAALLRERIRPFILRRRKADVAPELPARTETVRHVELGTEERALYDALRLAARREVAEKVGSGGSVLDALAALLRLRQACCDPRLVPGAAVNTTGPAAKTRDLLALLEESIAEGHRTLVFSQWTSYLDLLGTALTDEGIAHLRLDGATADRAGVVSAFQAEGGPPVMLISLKAGGVGLNLTAADHVVIMDPWWNPAAEDQAADRAHRIGQTRPVMIHRLVAEDTVEERLLALQAAKRGLADAALAGGGGPDLTRDDLLALLS